eukprot:1161386-Pelagomonas_calceolata.AAC.8
MYAATTALFHLPVASAYARSRLGGSSRVGAGRTQPWVREGREDQPLLLAVPGAREGRVVQQTMASASQ